MHTRGWGEGDETDTHSSNYPTCLASLLVSLGGLDLSQQSKKWHLDCQKILNSQKNDISTNLDEVYGFKSQEKSLEKY